MIDPAVNVRKLCTVTIRSEAPGITQEDRYGSKVRVALAC
jgi:hypothetical protein